MAKQPRQKGKRQGNFVRRNVRAGEKSREKLTEPTVCPQCGLLYRNGRWVMEPGPAECNEQLCPACVKANNEDPAGIITLTGDFLAQHENEIINLVENVESRGRMEHPLARIIETESSAESMVITTTDTHLARAIGAAIHEAYEGEIDYQFTDDPEFVRITWQR